MLRLFIGVLIPLSILLPVIMALFNYRVLTCPAKKVFGYLIFSGCMNVLAIILARNGITNLPLLHVYTPLELLVLILFYRNVLAGMIIEKVSVYLVMAFAVFCILNAVWWQSLFSYNTWPRSLEGLLIIIYALFFFYRLLNTEEALPWYKNPLVWFNMGWLFYFSGALCLFLFSQALMKADLAYDIAWVIHASLVFVMYLLFTIGFAQYRQLKNTYSTAIADG